MNWEILWSNLFAILIGLSIALTYHRSKVSKSLRITLADFEEYIQATRDDQKQIDELGNQANTVAEKHGYRILQKERRKHFTGENLAVELKRMKQQAKELAGGGE